MSFLFTLFIAGSIYAAGPSVTAQYAAVQVRPIATVRTDVIDETEATYPLNADGKVSVSNINGSIEVEGWDRPEVRLVSKKVANSQERLADLEIKITSRQDLFKVEVEYKRWKGKWVKNDKLYVNFKLMVPRSAFVDEVESANGSVKVSELSNLVVVSAVNGSVTGSSLRGTVRLATVNGTVKAKFLELDPETQILLTTVNGSAQIMMPSNVNATVKADSVNGPISNDYGLPVKKGKYVGRGLYGSIGTGATSVKLNSVNGSIKINRNEDGLSIGPIKNLLPQKTSDDFNDTFDEKMRAKAESLRSIKGAEAIARESIRASQEVEREALRQSDRIISGAANVTAETLIAALTDIRTIEIDPSRINAEVAAVTRTLSGNRPAPFILEDSKTVSVEGVPSIQVKANGCKVTVKGWDKNEVKYVVSRLARGRTSPVKGVGFTHKDSDIRLNVQVTRRAASDSVLEQVTVEVYVPRESNLKINTDKEIRLEGVAGELDLNGKYGGIDVRDAGGSLYLESKKGTVRVIGFDGDLDSRIDNADMYLDGDFRNISSYSKSGKVYLTMDEGSGALIKTNSMGADKTDSGLRLENKSEGVWQVGEGNAEFQFQFLSGSLIVRPRTVFDSE